MNSSNVCSIHRRGRERERVRWLQHGRYWLFLCSVRLVDVSVSVSPRAALERTSTHLAWSSASWALTRKVCWVWLSLSMCLTSDFSPADDGTTLTSNPGRGTTRAPLDSCPLLCKYSTSGSALVTATHILIQLFPFSCTWRCPHSRQFSPVRDVCLSGAAFLFCSVTPRFSRLRLASKHSGHTRLVLLSKVFEHFAQMAAPQDLQWCLRLVKLKLSLQPLHVCFSFSFFLEVFWKKKTKEKNTQHRSHVSRSSVSSVSAKLNQKECLWLASPFVCLAACLPFLLCVNTDRHPQWHTILL